jgi:acetyl esterase/lipase
MKPFPKESSELLHPDEPTLSKARLYNSYLEDGENNACMLVIPGGGYHMISHHEGPPVAGWLNSIGISAVVLEYTVGENIFPSPQQQAIYALRSIRANAARHKIDANRIGVIGFSAGGHLAASISNGFDREDWLLDPDHTLGDLSARPDASILCYPVISSGAKGHAGSFNNLFGTDASDEIRAQVSWERQAHPLSPATFLWHAAEDTAVPVENSYLMAMALQKNKTPHELHVFPKGNHGLGLCTIGNRRHECATQWRGLAEHWLHKIGF